MPSPSRAFATTFRFSPRSCSIRAGAPASSPPRSSPRNFPTASSARARPARWRARSPPSRPPSTTCSASASAASPGSSNSAVTRERRRAIWLGGDEFRPTSRARRRSDHRAVRGRQQSRPFLELGSRHAGLDRHARRRRARHACADDPERFRARLPRHRGESLRLHRARSALRAADAGEEAVRQREGRALPDAGPRRFDRRRRRPGGQGRRDAWPSSRR